MDVESGNALFVLNTLQSPLSVAEKDCLAVYFLGAFLMVSGLATCEVNIYCL
jgi:hypothetical protein